MKSKSGISACLKVPSGHQAVLLALCLVQSLSASADTTTLMVTGASKVTSNSPETIQFPVTRSGDINYPAVLRFHTLDGSALAGTDYIATRSDVVVPAGSSSATVPVTLAANTTGGATRTFQLLLDAATGIGPEPSFDAQQTFLTGPGAQSVATADVNGDGKPDLIVANYEGSTVSVRLNTTAPGAITPSFASWPPFNVGLNPISVTTADVNGDGRPDLLVANRGASTVSVRLNTTAPGAITPSFASQQTFATSAQSIKAADVNGDGKPDLVVVNAGNPAVSVLLNTTAAGAATPSFAGQQTFATGSNPFDVTCPDVNGDGRPDLVVANRTGSTISVLLNTTAPGATTPSFAAQQVFAVGREARAVAASDVNGDGKPDLVVANDVDNTVSVLLNTTTPGAASPSFAAQQTFATGAEPVSVAAADVNGDGKPDLLVANANWRERRSATVSVLLNINAPGATTPSFAAQRSFATGANSQSVTAADVNGDGWPELIVANFNGNSVSVLRNATVPSGAALSFASPQTFATGANAWRLSTTDLNGDGRPDLSVPNNIDHTVSVMLNITAPGATTPSFVAQQVFAAGIEPRSVAAGEINGDGKPDLVIANDVDNTISVLVNTTAPGASTPSFAPQRTFATGVYSTFVAIADLNGDGKPDLAVSGGSSVSVLLNSTAPGTATLSFSAQQSFVVGSQATVVVTEDINGDGKRDLSLANYDSNTVSVLLNTTAPGATTPSFAVQQTFATGTNPASVAAADLNGDGKPDLVAANRLSATVSVLLSTTSPGAVTPSFANQQTFATGPGPYDVKVADVNGDAKPDVLVSSQNAINGTNPAVSVLLNDTTPGAATLSLVAPLTIATGGFPVSVAAADVNGDGMPDLVVVNSTAKTVSVLLNRQYHAAFAGSPATGTIVQHYVFANGFE